MPISVLPRSLRALRVDERYTLLVPLQAAAAAATTAASLTAPATLSAAIDITTFTFASFSSAATFTSPPLLTDGVVMSLWVGDEAASSCSRQLVRWDPPEGEHRLGTLRWCAPGMRSRGGQELVVHVSEMPLGRQSPALRSPEAERNATALQCFSLLGSRCKILFTAQCESTIGWEKGGGGGVRWE